MSRSPIVTWTLHDGSTLKASDSFSKTFLAKMKALGHREVAHMRMGRFSVMTYQPRITRQRVVIAQMYAMTKDPRNALARTSRFWDSHVRDRTSQCMRVLALIDGHPLESAVRAEIQIELDSFK